MTWSLRHVKYNTRHLKETDGQHKYSLWFASHSEIKGPGAYAELSITANRINFIKRSSAQTKMNNTSVLAQITGSVDSHPVIPNNLDLQQVVRSKANKYVAFLYTWRPESTPCVDDYQWLRHISIFNQYNNVKVIDLARRLTRRFVQTGLQSCQVLRRTRNE